MHMSSCIPFSKLQKIQLSLIISYTVLLEPLLNDISDSSDEVQQTTDIKEQGEKVLIQSSHGIRCFKISPLKMIYMALLYFYFSLAH